MQTELLSSLELARAASLLQAGEVVAFPTETVYGLGASLANPRAIQKLFQAKGRPQDNPLIVHLSDFGQLESVALEIPSVFYRLAEAFVPGPLTMVLKRHPSVSELVSAGLQTVAVRFPSHPLAQELIRLAGFPLAAPSANLSGRPSATTPAHVLEDLQGKIAAVVDGGHCPLGIESTVLYFPEGGVPLLLRPGGITQEQIEEVLHVKIALFSGKAESREAKLSPGMRHRHYAPKARIKMFVRLEELTSYLERAPLAKRMFLSRKEEFSLPKIDHFSLTGRTLYALLRLSDQEKYEEILVFCDAETLKDLALMNRLHRAAE